MQNYERKLKVTNHGNKLGQRLFGYAQNHRLWDYITDSRLSPLVSSAHSLVDHELLSAFLERWHADTSSFHLPFGEMTITLDDVSCLLHLPITGNYYRAPPTSVTTDQAIHLAHVYLGVTMEEAGMECRASSGPYYRFEWLQEIVSRVSIDDDMRPAVRAFILLILSWSIFTVKTGDRAEAKWLLLLEDVSAAAVGSYAWGAAALAFMYDQLNYSSLDQASQLGGYATLLQSWILWYFPQLVERRTGREGGALCGRWRKKKTDAVKLRAYRQRIDALTSADVCWRPFEEHREGRDFEQVSLYRGHISWGDITVPYMPDRCLRQFGYVQCIPRHPLTDRPSHADCIFRIAHYMPVVEDVLRTTYPAEELGQVAPDYLHWYVRASIPRLLRVASPPPPPVQPDAQPDLLHHLLRMEAEIRRGLQAGEIRMGTRCYARLTQLLETRPRDD